MVSGDKNRCASRRFATLCDRAIRAPASHCYWSIAELLSAWQQMAQDDGHWHAHRHGGYRPGACDLVGFWRPPLQGCLTKHYCAQAGKALPAISLGIAVRLGTAGSQRLAIPCLLVQADPDEPGERALQQGCDSTRRHSLPRRSPRD